MGGKLRLTEPLVLKPARVSNDRARALRQENRMSSETQTSRRRLTVSVHYWASSNREVDFVLVKGSRVVAIEVKSSRRPGRLPGMKAFSDEFKVHKKLLVGADGIPIEQFMTTDLLNWFQ